jgi:hypothetical protein
MFSQVRQPVAVNMASFLRDNLFTPFMVKPDGERLPRHAWKGSFGLFDERQKLSAL